MNEGELKWKVKTTKKTPLKLIKRCLQKNTKNNNNILIVFIP